MPGRDGSDGLPGTPGQAGAPGMPGSSHSERTRFDEDDIRDICVAVLKGFRMVILEIFVDFNRYFSERLSELSASFIGPPGPPGKSRPGRPGAQGERGTPGKLCQSIYGI